MRRAASLVAMLLIGIDRAPAQTYTEQDFVRQSKFCEVATRLPSGDPDQHRWGDCMERQGELRSDEKRNTDYRIPQIPWNRALSKSNVWTIDDACQLLARRDTSTPNPKEDEHPHLYGRNHAWAQCMRREGVFGAGKQ